MCKNLRLDTIRRLICDDPGTLMKIHGRHTRRPQTKPSKATETEAKSSGLVHVDKQDTGLDSASRCTEKPPVIPTRTRIPPDREYKRMDSNDLAFIFNENSKPAPLNDEFRSVVLHILRALFVVYGGGRVHALGTEPTNLLALPAANPVGALSNPESDAIGAAFWLVESALSSSRPRCYLDVRGIFKDKTDYPTLTRMSYCQCRLKLVFLSIFKQFGWTHVALILDRSDLFSLTVGEFILIHTKAVSKGCKRIVVDPLK
ncbi:unnamed protein product [Bemisia tabaci]|uniref:Receptor ligand binding region domain-containing protein n=1 Tax=Bemisia tabaci TaxID=7038 RepID=A0A9P0A0A0_BEMTA|nr:unnamed protein product [Bemisia tabaci]